MDQRQSRMIPRPIGDAGKIISSNGRFPVWVGPGAVYLESYAPSQSSDWTDAHDAAIAAVVAKDGGQVILPPGQIDLAGRVEWPSNVAPWGQGGGTSGTNSGTRIEATDTDACYAFGVQGSGSWGGVGGNFCLDGNDVSATMLYLGRTLERVFHGVSVVGCAGGGSAVQIEEAQNNQFFGLVVNSNGGSGITFDRGAAGNRFYGVEFSSNGIEGGYHVCFTATATPITNLATYPLNNHVFGGIFERDGGLLDAIVYHGAGADNVFWAVNLGGGGATRAFPLVKMEVGNAAITTQSTRLKFVECLFTGAATQTTVFDVDDGSVIYLDGNPLIQAHLNQFMWRDTLSRIYLRGGEPIVSAVTNTDAAGSTGNATQERIEFSRMSVIGASAIHQTTINGDANTLLIVEKAAGTDQVAVNTNTPALLLPNATDFVMYSGNYATPVYSIDGATGVQYAGAVGTSTPSLRFGSATPEGAVTAPVGSLYLRTDGGAATTIYVKESGSGNTGWVAK